MEKRNKKIQWGEQLVDLLKYIEILNDFQEYIKNKLLDLNHKVIIIKGDSDYGKTTILSKLFSEYNNFLKIYQSSSSLNSRKILEDGFIFELNHIKRLFFKDTKVLFLDEFSNYSIINDLYKWNDIFKIYITIKEEDILSKLYTEYYILDIEKEYKNYIFTKKILEESFFSKNIKQSIILLDSNYSEKSFKNKEKAKSSFLFVGKEYTWIKTYCFE